MSENKEVPGFLGDLIAAAAFFAGFFYLIVFTIADLATDELSTGQKKYPFMSEPVQNLDAIVEIEWSHFMISTCTLIFSLSLVTFMILLGALTIGQMNGSFLIFRNPKALSLSMQKVGSALFVINNFVALVILPLTAFRLAFAPGTAFLLGFTMILGLFIILGLICVLYWRYRAI
jgi:hypothetical protein